MLTAIWAETADGFIGCDDGSLPWGKPNKTDMEWFHSVIRGKDLIMGRKTWDSLGRSRLKGTGDQYIITHDDEDLDYVRREFMVNPKSICQGYIAPKIAVIGGLQIYNVFMDKTDTIYRTVFSDYDNRSEDEIGLISTQHKGTVKAPKIPDGFTRTFHAIGSCEEDLEFEIWRRK